MLLQSENGAFAVMQRSWYECTTTAVPCVPHSKYKRTTVGVPLQERCFQITQGVFLDCRNTPGIWRGNGFRAGSQTLSAPGTLTLLLRMFILMGNTSWNMLLVPSMCRSRIWHDRWPMRKDSSAMEDIGGVR